MLVSFSRKALTLTAVLAVGACATPSEYRFENQLTAFNNPGAEQSLPTATDGEDQSNIDRDAGRFDERLRDGHFSTPDPTGTATQNSPIRPASPPPAKNPSGAKD